jgi:signal transduction histidine kinase
MLLVSLIIIVGIVAALSTIAAVVFLILMIVFFKRKSKTPAIVFLALMFLFGTVAALSWGGLIWALRGGIAEMNSGWRAEYQAKRAKRLAMLKNCVPDEFKNSVPPDFFNNEGEYDWYRFPLAYPYEILAIDSLDAGSLKRYDEDSYSSGFSGYITHLSFTKSFLLARTVAEKWTKNQTPAWVLFDFKTGKTISFKSKQELIDAAKSLGYSGDVDLLSIEKRYNECFP